MSEHPFLTTATEIPWPELTPDHLVPDMREAIRRADAALDELLARADEALSYETSFGAYADLTRAVGEPWSLATHLEAVLNTPGFRQAFQEAQPEVTRFFSRLPLHAELWRKLRVFGESSAVAGLDPVRRRHVEEVMADFREAGADLPEERKERLLAIEEELATLTSRFSDHHLDSLNAFELVLDDPAELAGLPESAREAARESAREKGYGTDGQPAWRFTLHGPSFVAFMRYAERRDRRREMLEAFYSLATEPERANEPLIWKIVGLRQEKAEILGQENFADVVLARRMAGTGAAALRFEEALFARIKERFDAEAAELQAFRAQETGESDPLEPWDMGFWQEKMRQARCRFDEEALRPYFAVDRVIEGLFALTEELFGVQVKECAGDARPPVWHPDVRVYELVDLDSRKTLGLFYTDWYPRETKRSGAWMAPLRTGAGTRASIGTMAGNMTKPLGGRPALLLHDEVETIFHEFGHLLHHLLSDVPVPELGGTDVAWDFVELPSQIMENWCWERVSLDRFARHHETGEPIPEELFQRLLATRTFRSASLMMRQLSFGRTDLLLHLEAARLLADETDLESWWREQNAAYLPPTGTTPRSNLRTFSHLFGDPVGYAAGYYSYLWADVLASDAFSRFKKEGVMNGATGRAFREQILARGNSAPPQELFRAFMGRDPDPDALLRAQGLV